MRGPGSLQLRLALVVGVAVTLFWLVAAVATANRASREISALFDANLQASAERLLPLALHDQRRRGGGEEGDDGEGDDSHRDDRVEGFDDDDDDRHGDEAQGTIAYRVRDAEGRLVLQSATADDALFPPALGPGFSETGDYRLFVTTRRDGVSIAVAEPLADRDSTARALMINLALPLLVLLPLCLIGLVWAVRRGLRPLRALQQGLAERGAKDLSPLPDAGLPTELHPIAEAVNNLLARLRSAFEAERSFAANAAHELRTPVAGAIAQTQRLRAETRDAAAAQRAADIEATLKRLMRSSEKLMQLARAEGGRLLQDQPADLRPVLRIVVGDFERADPGRCALELPPGPVLSLIEPDALGILLRNLIENALRHGAPGAAVRIGLTPEAELSVTNAGPVLGAAEISRFGARFEKGSDSNGTGLGLAIVRTIAERAGVKLAFQSPGRGQDNGLSVILSLPVAG